LLKIFRNLLLFVLSGAISVILCLNVFDKMVTIFADFPAAYIGMRIFITLFLFIVSIMIIDKKISGRQLDLIFILFVALIFLMSVLRKNWISAYQQRSVNFNPLKIINDFKHADNSLFLLLGNVFLFVPVGAYLQHKLKNWRSVQLFVLFISFPLVIELCQFIFKTGIFDINDIFLNVFGLVLGSFLYKIAQRRVLEKARLKN